jgi:hypothetical protein
MNDVSGIQTHSHSVLINGSTAAKCRPKLQQQTTISTKTTSEHLSTYWQHNHSDSNKNNKKQQN